MPTRAISRSRDLPKLACFLAGDTRDIATHVFVVGHAKIGRFYRHEIFAFASAYTVLLENNDLFGVLGVFCNGHCAQNCCRISKQTSGGFRTCLGGKKISELFWEIRPGSPPTFNKTAENRTFVVSGRNFFVRHQTRKLISGGFRACLGREKTFLQFWKIRPGRPPTTKPKIRHL